MLSSRAQRGCDIGRSRVTCLRVARNEWPVAKKKNRSKKRQRGHPAKTAVELLLENKAKAFLKAEKAYWKQQQSLRHQYAALGNELSLGTEHLLPQELSSTVWGLRDGVAFVRHIPVKGHLGVSFRSLPWTLEQWATDGPILPLEQGDLFLGRTGVKVGLSGMTFVDCLVSGVEIPYAEFGWLRFGEGKAPPTVERAILDFQLTVLGIQMQVGQPPSGPVTAETTLQRLDQIAQEFESLLGKEAKEEELQLFLKANPFVLHPAAEAIPKKKLGEDFVTDFVLVAPNSQGPTYILVELERATHSVLNKDCSLAGPVNRALKQTRDWDVWLEDNKAYWQGKLPGFETPTYMVVIGRGHELGEKQRKYLRSYNREWKNIELLTYDDVLVRYRSVIAGLKSLNTRTET